MFGRKKIQPLRYDPAAQKPILHRSICNGETTAGFKDLASGKYHEVMLIRDEQDLRAFMEACGLETAPDTEY